MSALRPGVITDEMIQAMDAAKRQGLQKDLRALAANIRADAEGRYDSAEPGWRSGVEWTLLWIENTAAQLTQSGGADGRQGVSPE
ncbi:hypothetical protein [Streptomyces rochei]|uniref:hypothetical protein n=1 Tax=Streptomyces rochei TaxID=1928 RepID=UPI0022E9A2F1|nr:hypothetical protein [Streptomyces rochei]MCC8452750.1 hypothetical protein [Streptomyces rochei]